MKRKLLSIAKHLVLVIAVFAAATPSQAGAYQKEAPEALKKH